MVLFPLQFILFWVLVGCVGWTAYLLAIRLTGYVRSSASTRWTAAALLACLIISQLFNATIYIGCFRLWIVTPIIAAMTVCSHWSLADGRGALALLTRDLRRLKKLSRVFRSPFYKVSALILLATLVLRIAWILVSPPVTYDALTYHLVKAGLWVQTGSMVHDGAPDAWGYYEYFPAVGDSFWAWSMLPTHSDEMLSVANLLVWCLLPLGAYALARLLTGFRRNAIAAAIAVAMTPVIYNLMDASYVEIQLVFFTLTSVLFGQRFWTHQHWADAFLTFASLGLCCGCKVTFVPILAMFLAIYFVRILMGFSIKRLAVLCATAFLGLSVMMPHHVETWIYRGNPLYPISVDVGSVHLPGNTQLKYLMDGGSEIDKAKEGLFTAEETFTIIWLTFYGKKLFRNSYVFGLGGLPIILMSLAAIPQIRKRRDLRFSVAITVFIAVWLNWTVFSQGGIMFRTIWENQIGRFLSPVFALICCLTVALPFRTTGKWLLLAAIVSVTQFRFKSINVDVSESIGVITVAVSIMLLFLVLLFRPQADRLNSVVRYTGAAAVVIVFLFGWVYIQQSYRYRIYSTMIPVIQYYGSYMKNWVAWKYLDRVPGCRVAITAGFEHTGHNWFRYPLMGTHLQNNVSFVPATVDGSVCDYKEGQPAERFSYEKWVERLRERRIDYVAALKPTSLEGIWMLENPDVFPIVVIDDLNESFLCRFNSAGVRTSGYN